MFMRVLRSCWRIVVRFATRVAATVLALFVFDVSKVIYRSAKREVLPETGAQAQAV